jgi:hypothetical protein
MTIIISLCPPLPISLLKLFDEKSVEKIEIGLFYGERRHTSRRERGNWRSLGYSGAFIGLGAEALRYNKRQAR